MTPTYTYSEHTTCDNTDLEIRGEIFEDVIKKSDNNKCKCLVSIIDITAKDYWGVTEGVGKGKIYFMELSSPELIEAVKAIKNNIEKYKL